MTDDKPDPVNRIKERLAELEAKGEKTTLDHDQFKAASDMLREMNAKLKRYRPKDKP